MSDRIACTVQVLTRNSERGIRTCLETLQDFAEVIVHDGESTDGTRAIAAEFPNVRIMDQNRAYLDQSGRIADFSAMRNESIAAARYDWVFVVDADERMDSAMTAEIRQIVASGKPGVYQAFRRFFVEAAPVQYCSAYPALQIRLFHRTLTGGYAKPIHERLALLPGVTLQMLRTELPVPLPPPEELEAKYERYLAMEARRQGVMSWRKWLRWVLYRNVRSAVGLTLKALWIRVRHSGDTYLPWAYERQFILHSVRTIMQTFPWRVAMRSRRKPPRSALP